MTKQEQDALKAKHIQQGRMEAIRALIKSKTVVYPKKHGYASCAKIEIVEPDDEAVLGVLREVGL